MAVCTREARSRMNGALHGGRQEVWGARMLFLRPLILTSMDNGIAAEGMGHETAVISSLGLEP